MTPIEHYLNMTDEERAADSLRRWEESERYAVKRAADRDAILKVLSDGEWHVIGDFRGNLRRRYSILNELEHEGVVVYDRAYPSSWKRALAARGPGKLAESGA